MTPMQTVAQKSRTLLESVAHDIQSIDTLPQIALRIMRVANDENCGTRDLKEVMEGDAALSFACSRR